MRVTDEMVEAFANVYHFRGQTYTPDLVRAALEAALSHAAGQEAVAWMRRNVTYKAVHGRTDGERVVSERKVYDDDLPLYLNTAPPTTSAEVGRDAARYRWLREEAGRDKRGSDHDRLHVSINYPTKMADGSGYTGLLVTPRGEEFDARVDAAMAASSGRQGAAARSEGGTITTEILDREDAGYGHSNFTE